MARSDLYWRMRAERLKKQIHRGDRIPYSKILQLYRQAFLAIDEDIRAIENARDKTVFAESEQAKRELAKIAAAAPDVRRQNEAIKAFSAYQQRIDRAELVKARAYAHLMKMAGTVSRTLGAYLSDVYKAARYGTADDMAKGLNCGIDFALIPERTIEKVIAAPFYGKNYSETVWDNTKEAAEKAQEVITEGLIRGSSYPKMAKALSKVANNTYYNAYRLIQTDTTHFIEQGRFDTYRDIGVKKYTYYATLGSKTCDVCAALDGRTFDVEEAREGKNKPPIHPHCMCYTVVGDVALTARMARDPATGKNYKVRGDMTYREWKDSLTDEQRMAIKAYRNRHADAAQYLRYTERLGKENLPKTLDLFQKMKYNDSERWQMLKRDYYDSKHFLQEQLQYRASNGEKKFIPGKALIKNVKTIAGSGTDKSLRVEQRLVEQYGGKVGDWKKRVGKVESSKYIFDIHWYELEGRQYETKMKFRKDK